MPVSNGDVAAGHDVERIQRGLVYHLERERSCLLVETDIVPAMLICRDSGWASGTLLPSFSFFLYEIPDVFVLFFRMIFRTRKNAP